jgi:hypothetical protein
MNADKVAEGILQFEEGERIRYGVADPAIFIRNGGPSIAESMLRCRWRRADNKRQPGWEAMRQRIEGQSGEPMLYVAHECEDFWRTVPTLQHDDDDPEDLDTDGEDHIADEVRYACMSRPWRPKLIPPAPGLILPRDVTSMTLNDIVARNKALRIQKEENSAY